MKTVKKAKEYRKMKVANRYFKKHSKRIRLSEAYKKCEVIEKVCAALGPLSNDSRKKVYRMLNIMFEDK